jgi:hypothetical protein
MPRYIVQRTFAGGLNIPVNAQGASICLAVVGTNAEGGVTWVYDGPTPEAIRRTAERNSLPVDSISEVSVLNPYFYR